MKLILIYLAAEVVLTAAVVIGARKHFGFRSRLHAGFKRLMGVQDHVPAALTFCDPSLFEDDDGPDYEADQRDGFRPEESEEEVPSNENH